MAPSLLRNALSYLITMSGALESPALLSTVHVSSVLMSYKYIRIDLYETLHTSEKTFTVKKPVIHILQFIGILF